MTLTKDYIVNSVHAQLDFSSNKPFELVESVLEIIKRDFLKVNRGVDS